MRRNFGRGPDADVVIAQYGQFARRTVEVAAVKNQKIFCAADSIEQIHAERTAVRNKIIDIGQRIFTVELFNRSDAETLVGPENIADAKN